MAKSLFYVCNGDKKIGSPYETYDEAYGFLTFLIMFKPFNFNYNIKEVKKVKVTKKVKKDG